MADTDPNSAITTLNPGVAGDTMDVSNVTGANDALTAIKRERIVLGGEKSRDAIAEVQNYPPPPSAYGSPTRDILMPDLMSTCYRIANAVERCATCLEILIGGEVPPGQD